MTTQALSLDLLIETPENVVLSHELAGPAWRVSAYLIDLGFRLAILFVAFIVTILLVSTIPGVALGSLLLLVFLLEWGYFIGFEFFLQGRTPGKMICGLRVVHENGQPLSWWGATLRNLVRVADTLPLMMVYGTQLGLLVLLPIYGPALVCMMLSPRLQRLGDLAARTVVIHERRSLLPRDPVIYDRIAPLERSEINRLVPGSDTLALIDQFLGRRSVLTYERGHELAAGLARSLMERLDYQGDRRQVERYPMAFLARVYVTFAPLPEDVAAELDDVRDLDLEADDDLRRRRRPARRLARGTR